MAIPKPALSFALAWFLLASLFLTGEATGLRCKPKQVRERKPTIETLRWQEACLPLAVILGGCCGLVWWVLCIIYDVSQKGGQKGWPQISGQAEMEEQKTMDRLEEWTEAGAKLDCTPGNKRNLPTQVEVEPYPPSQPKEQGPTTFWAYLEQELEKILLAVRRHGTTGQNLVAGEQVKPHAVEQPNPMLGDWQSFLAHIKKYPLATEGQGSLGVEKQQALARERPHSKAVVIQHPSPEEGQSSPIQHKQSPSSGEMQISPARGRKKSPKRTRSRSKRKSTSSSRNRGRHSPAGTRGGRSPSRTRGCCCPPRNRGYSSGRRRLHK